MDIDTLKKKAETDLQAQLQLGRMYWTGEGVSQDLKEAFKYFELAKEQHNNQEAMYYIGLCYKEGYGCPVDERKALIEMDTLAHQGYRYAQTCLGDWFHKGICGEANYQSAVHWYREAANQGDPNAQIALGKLYECGHGVETSKEEAKKWYRKASEQGNSVAQYNLARLLIEKRYTLSQQEQKKDALEAINLFQLAAGQGNADALIHFGRCLFWGIYFSFLRAWDYIKIRKTTGLVAI